MGSGGSESCQSQDVHGSGGSDPLAKRGREVRAAEEDECQDPERGPKLKLYWKKEGNVSFIDLDCGLRTQRP